MKTIEFLGKTMFVNTRTLTVYEDKKGLYKVPAYRYTAAALKAVILAHDKRRKNTLADVPGNGGRREGAGRKPRTREKQIVRSVKLTDAEFYYIQKNHGTFAEAVRTLLPSGWEFEN